jgi:hypothetical protein
LKVARHQEVKMMKRFVLAALESQIAGGPAQDDLHAS